MTTFTGKAGVDTYRAIALISGLRLYARTKMKPNRMWTPTAMLALATHYTGRAYKRGEYDQAIEDMQGWVATHGTRQDRYDYSK